MCVAAYTVSVCIYIHTHLHACVQIAGEHAHCNIRLLFKILHGLSW